MKDEKEHFFSTLNESTKHIINEQMKRYNYVKYMNKK